MILLTYSFQNKVQLPINKAKRLFCVSQALSMWWQREVFYISNMSLESHVKYWPYIA